MTEEMIDLYKQFSTNDKRNELNLLILKINQLLDQYLLTKQVDIKIFPKVSNYDSLNQANELEDDILLMNYIELWNLKTKILFLLALGQ